MKAITAVKKSNKHRSKRAGNYKMKKTSVAGIVERGGRVSAKVLDLPWKGRILAPIRERVLPSSMIVTDEAPHYHDLRSLGSIIVASTIRRAFT